MSVRTNTYCRTLAISLYTFIGIHMWHHFW